MSNLTSIPLEDWFKTSLTQEWNWATWTIYIATAPTFTFPGSTTTYIVVNPWKTNMQIAKINAYSSANKTMTVSSITVNKWASVSSTAQTHSVWSVVIISDNYQFWEDIKTAINSKLDDDQDWTWDSATTFWWMIAKTLTTAQRLALTPTNWMIVYDTTLWEIYQYIWGAWSSISAWSTQPNASTTVAWKVEVATQTEFDAWTATGWTWASLLATPDMINKLINTSTAKTSIVSADRVWIADSAASWVNKYITYANFRTQLLTDNTAYNSKFWGTWADWALAVSSWTTTISLSSDKVVKNYSSITITWGTTQITWVSWNPWAYAIIKCKWDFTMSSWTFKMDWQWWVWSQNWLDIQSVTASSVKWADWSGVTPWNAWTANAFLLSVRGRWVIKAQCWAGWGLWGTWTADWGWAWWAWWRWGWILIIEVWWAINFTWWTIQSNWSTWSTWSNWAGAAWGWWWGGWWWAWTIVILYNTLTSTAWTVTCTWWAWWNWWNWWSGWWFAWNWGWWGWWGWSYSAWWGWGGTSTVWTWASNNSYWNWWAWWTDGADSIWSGWWWGWGWAPWAYYIEQNIDF